MSRTNSCGLPFLMDQPTPRRIGIILSERAQRSARNELRGVKECVALRRSQFAGEYGRMNSAPPKNLIRHPIADPRETTLHEQDGFDRRFAMPIQKLLDETPVECMRNDFWNIGRPPIGRDLSMMEADAAELT